jgi:hypothetical protein
VEEIDLAGGRGRLIAGDPSRLAVVLPGAAYLAAYPLLWFAREVIRSRGWSVLEVLDTWDRSDPQDWAESRTRAAFAHLPHASRRLLVAKSISSHAAPMAAEQAIPAIWLTPLLGEEQVRQGLAACSAPALLVGSTADGTWDSRAAAMVAPARVLELSGADHSLQLPGDPLGSIDLLREVTAAIDAFVAGL